MHPQFINNSLFRVLGYVDLYSDFLIALQLCLTIGWFFLPNSRTVYTAHTRTPITSATLEYSLFYPFAAILSLTTLISTVPGIPWINFICHILGNLTEIQFVFL